MCQGSKPYHNQKPTIINSFLSVFLSPTSQRPQAKAHMIKDRKPTNHGEVDFHSFPKRLTYQVKFFTEPTIS
ncbi:uncharacterized protein Bfra_005662 [Botrytis fragariae]|uniref:Uncharacterized protein n=1 Tax=Botrytis fragariae TaxID=1964551 RepID=A0A8H6ARY9_9HELO|nr:uncharacterized protein Bfra_005662 [Botrytis fragariae]KAF5872305.1 hypothetical protein Bfra_005662 [Botrytis fragariae]